MRVLSAMYEEWCVLYEENERNKSEKSVMREEMCVLREEMCALRERMCVMREELCALRQDGIRSLSDASSRRHIRDASRQDEILDESYASAAVSPPTSTVGGVAAVSLVKLGNEVIVPEQVESDGMKNVTIAADQKKEERREYYRQYRLKKKGNSIQVTK